MASKSFRCRLVTPSASLLDERATYASIPAWDGLFGVLPGRAPILARLGMGELRLEFPSAGQAAGGSRRYVLDGGFVRMEGEELTILAERAAPVETLTVPDAEAELKAIESKPLPTAKVGAERDAFAERRKRDLDFARLKIRAASTKGAI